ncbi:type 1 glutamine amidotransferase [Leucobacter luti]|uniref:type 1 glutamine amidotransferase n=1 Tax=Leucobacter luti TaxID=340320 RepID=UPI003D076169
MTEPRVLVVEHQENAGLGLFGQRLSRPESGVAIETVGPEAGRTIPTSLDGYDALIVLGGAMGPTEDDKAPWLPATRALLVEGVERGIPTLGICLGAQMLATATGGNVRTMPGGPEVGLLGIDVVPSAEGDPLFGPLAGRTVQAVQWHWLEADGLPAGARVLASSPACRNQAFRLGDAAWGVQFHPEALGRTAAEWVDEDREGFEVLGLDEAEVVAEVRAAEPSLAEIWGGLADRFAAVTREAPAARAARHAAMPPAPPRPSLS